MKNALKRMLIAKHQLVWTTVHLFCLISYGTILEKTTAFGINFVLSERLLVSKSLVQSSNTYSRYLLLLIHTCYKLQFGKDIPKDIHTINK